MTILNFALRQSGLRSFGVIKTWMRVSILIYIRLCYHMLISSVLTYAISTISFKFIFYE